MRANIRTVSGDFFHFQQNSAVHQPMYSPWDGRVAAARGSSFHCSQSAASQQLRPQPRWLQGVGIGEYKTVFIGWRCERLTIWSSDWLTCGAVWSKASLTTRSTSGVLRLNVPVSMQNEDILNSHCNLHLNFLMNWHLFVNSEVQCIILMWKCLCLRQPSFHKVVQQRV